MPDPIDPSPTPQDFALSGGSWASGAGHTQTSGSPTNYAEYKQWMTIDYTRNPWFTTAIATDPYRSLAQVSAVDVKNVYGSRLHFNITVHNSCTIVSGTFDLSASYQAQKFAVLSNKFDKAGYSYGEVTGANNAYVFGPQGSLVSTQPYIRRNASGVGDVPYSFTQYGTTDALSTSGNPIFTWGQGDLIGQPYSTYLNEYYDIHTGAEFPHSQRQAGNVYSMQGGQYNTSSEPGFGNNSAGIQILQNFIEQNCSYLASSSYYYRFVVPNPLETGHSVPREGDRLAVNPYYNTAFHDYN